MSNLATSHPAEVINISPEGLEIANCYLQLQDAQKVSEMLDIPLEQISQTLNRHEVRAYVNHIFQEAGFNNRFKMRDALDTIISRKFQEMDEAGVGSNKDIAELLALSHKFTTDIIDREIALEKLRSSNVRTQTNIQINDNAGTNYATLIERLVGAK